MKSLVLLMSIFFIHGVFAQENKETIKYFPTLGGISKGDKVPVNSVRKKTAVSMLDEAGNKAEGVEIIGGSVTVTGLSVQGEIEKGGALDEGARIALAQSAGRIVKILLTYETPEKEKKHTVMVFTVYE